MNVTDTLPDWNSLPGTTLDGGYELKEILEAEGERATLRVRVLGDYSLRASARFFVLEPPAAREEVALWQSVRLLDSRPNLDVPLGTGVLSINGTTLAYLVSQIADETLADVLAGRALEIDETTDVLRAVARGLGALHGSGYVHGCVSADEVLAVENDIRLSIGSLRRANAQPLLELKPAKYLAPESGTQNVTIAADVWCLGATVFEALTRKTYEPGLFEEAAALKHPFGTLLERCLESDPDRRIGLAEFEGILRSKAPPPRPKPVPAPAAEAFKTATAGASGNGNGTHAVTTPVEQLSAAATAIPQTPVKAAVNGTGATHAMPVPVTPLPATPAVQAELPPSRFTEPKPKMEFAQASRAARHQHIWDAEPPARSVAQRRAWIYAVSAFVAIFFALWFLRTYSHSVANRSAKIIHQPPQTATPQPGPAWPTKTLNPDAKTPVTSAGTAAGSAASGAAAAAGPGAATTPGSARTIWRVVLYTYMRPEDADHKAQAINAKRPGLHAATFSPSGTGAPYLVVAGGQMNRQAAAQLRGQAVREGMPHDSYIQNFNH